MQEIAITIRPKWSSKFQRSVAYQTFIIMLKAWSALRRATHKKSNVQLFIDGSDIDDIQPDSI